MRGSRDLEFSYCGYRAIVRPDVHKGSQADPRGEEVHGIAGLLIGWFPCQQLW